jgi:hypothetical protein
MMMPPGPETWPGVLLSAGGGRSISLPRSSPHKTKALPGHQDQRNGTDGADGEGIVLTVALLLPLSLLARLNLRKHTRRCYGASGESMTFSAPVINERSAPMPKPDDLSRSFTAFEQDSTLIAIIEMSLTSWLVAGIVPGIERHPLKKLDVDEEALLQLLHRWRDEAINAGRKRAVE